MQEVSGSIPLGSTNFLRKYPPDPTYMLDIMPRC
jgi:hypothetical protein